MRMSASEEARRDLGVDRLGDRIRELTGVTKDDQIDKMVREMLTRTEAVTPNPQDSGRYHATLQSAAAGAWAPSSS